MIKYSKKLQNTNRFCYESKFMLIVFASLLMVSLGSSTDLNNIESITPSGTNPISITGDLDMNNNNINNFFGSSCSTGNVAAHINDDGTLDCVDATSEVQNDFVDRSGDTMTGNLDMQSNNIESVNVLTVDSVDLTGGYGTGGIDLGNEALYNLDSFSFNDPGTDGSIDWAGSGAEIYPAPLDDSNSDGYLQIVNDGGIAFEPGSDGTTAATFETGGNLNLKDNQLNNVDWANSDNPDTTIADDQTLSTTADVSGTNDQITIDNGNSITIDDDFEANTNTQLDDEAAQSNVNINEYNLNSVDQISSSVDGNDFWQLNDGSGGSNTAPYTMRFDTRDWRLWAGDTSQTVLQLSQDGTVDVSNGNLDLNGNNINSVNNLNVNGRITASSGTEPIRVGRGSGENSIASNGQSWVGYGGGSNGVLLGYYGSPEVRLGDGSTKVSVRGDLDLNEYNSGFTLPTGADAY